MSNAFTELEWIELWCWWEAADLALVSGTARTRILVEDFTLGTTVLARDMIDIEWCVIRVAWNAVRPICVSKLIFIFVS